MLLAWLLRDFAEPLLDHIPWIHTIGLKPSKEWYGTQAVLRVSFGSFSFFTLFALVLIGVKDQREQRDGWHHGGWMVKLCLWALLTLLAFLAPNSLIGAYGQLARFGSGLFLLVQVVILLDFSHSWNAAWVEKDEQKWYIALLAVSLFCFLLAFTMAGLLLHWFAPSGQDCQLNIFFITLSLLLVAAFTAASLHPAVNGSLLPSSLIAVYSMYLCYSALASEPRHYACNGLAKHLNAVSAGTLASGMLLTLLSVVYSAVRAGSSSGTFLSPPGSPRGSTREPMLPTTAEGKHGRADPIDEVSESDDDDAPMMRRGKNDAGRPKPVRYVYSFFHVIFALASMYSAMLLTGWGSKGMEGRDIIDVGWPSVWVKIVSQWVTAALYIWTMLAPIVFPDRDFS
jgi:hypothetical protein